VGVCIILVWWHTKNTTHGDQSWCGGTLTQVTTHFDQASPPSHLYPTPTTHKSFSFVTTNCKKETFIWCSCLFLITHTDQGLPIKTPFNLYTSDAHWHG
jgi:hypothetical protein